MGDARIGPWLDWGRRRRSWADLTCEEYARRARAWLGWCQGRGIRPDRANKRDVNAWLDSLHPSPSVRSHALCALRAWYDWRQDVRGGRNPAREVESVPVRRTVVRSLERDEARRVLDVSARHGADWACVCGLMLYAGLRRSEVRRARWVDLEGSDQWLRVRGKGGQESMLPVHPQLRGMVMRWRTIGVSPVWMFPSPRDPRHPIAVATLTKRMRAILDEAGLPHATGHWLRHTYGSTVLEGSGDVAATQAALRHASLSSTTVYVRARDAQVRAAVSALDY